MGNKKILIIAGIVAALAVVIVLFASMRGNNNQNNPNLENENTGTINEGDVLVITPSPTPFGRAGFKIVSDPANPYAANLPRSNEPAPVDSSFDDYNDAVDSGQIPNQNGEFAQTAGTNPLSFAKSGGFDYTLSTEEFIDKNYPSLAAITASTSAGSSGTTSSGAPKDPNDVFVDTSDQSIPDTVPTLPDVDVTLFSTSTNDRADLIKYVEELSTTTAALDIVFEQEFVTGLAKEANQELLDALKSEALLIQNQVRAIKVPPQYIGMSQAYYKLYGQYATLVDRQTQLLKVTTRAQYDAAIAAYERDLEPFSITYGLIYLNADIIKKQLSQ